MKSWLKKALIALCCTTLAVTSGLIVACSCSCRGNGGDSTSSNSTSIDSTSIDSTSSDSTSIDSTSSDSTSSVCTHEWQETVVTAPTCTTDGTTKRTCTKCEETETVTVKAAHSYGEATVVEATCTKNGSKTTTCTVCGDEKTEVLSATGHSYAVSKQVAATCTVQGYDEYTCANCGDGYTEITADVKGHNTLTAEWTVAGEEQVNGCAWVQYEEATCADCGETVQHEETIVKHEYSVAITTVATCSKDGEKTYTCDCGEQYTEPFKNEGGHAWVAGTTDTSTGITTWTCSHNDAHTKTSFSAKDMVAATIPAAAIQDAKEIELQNATLELPQEVKNQLNGEVDLSVDKLDETAKNEATSNLTVEEQAKLANAPIYNFQMTQGSEAVTKFDKEITVTVPYDLEDGADPADIAVWYIDDEGKLTSIQATYSVVEGKGYATFTTDHFSYYTVVRLSAEERCALYGHEETTTVVAATCETDGYTLTKCIRCNKTTRTNFVKALGHTYESKTVAPTCTAKGYTTNTCTREGCGYSYTSNWTATIAHSYAATVVAPTCTAKGYTVNTCSACGDTYLDTYVDALGHAYAEGACTVCGKVDPSYVEIDEVNFYFNAIEGLLNAESYYLEVKELTVENTDIYCGKQSNDIKVETRSSITNIQDMQMEVSFDDNDYLAGKGVANVTVTLDMGTGKVETQIASAQVALYNGNIYALAKLEQVVDGRTVTEENLITISQDDLLAQMGVSMEMLQGMLQGASELEDLTAILEGIKNTPDSPLNGIIADIIEYVYTKTETANGYHFEMNFDRIKEVYEVLTTKTVGEIVDLVIMEGAYDKIVTYLTTTVNKNVSVVVEDLTKAFALCGVDIENVYNLINLMAGEEAGDIRQVIAQYSTMKVSELLDGMTGVEEPGSVDYAAMITEYAAQIKTLTLMDIAAMMGGQAQPETSNSGVVMIDEDEPADEPMVDPVYAMLMEIVEVLKKSSFSFDTDKTGEVLNYTVKLVNFGEPMTLEEKIEEMKAEMTADDYSGYSSSLSKVSAEIVFKPNGTFIGSVDSIIAQGEEMKTIADGFFAEAKAGKFELNGDEELYVDAKDEQIACAIRVYKSYDEPVEETYADQPAMKVYCYGEIRLLELPCSMVQKQSDCLAWGYYSVQGTCYEGDLTIWVNADQEIIGFDVSEASAQGFLSVANFYYNATTGEYVAGWREDGMHNYVLMQHKPAVGCEGEGYYKYSCTVCGDVQMEYYTNGHDTESVLELAPGSTNCEDGVYMVEYCTVCGEETYRWQYSTWHEMEDRTQVIATTKCGDVVLEYFACPCGEEIDINRIYGCEFDYIGSEYVGDENLPDSEKKYVETYRCSVTDCAYTYTITSYYEVDGCDVTEYVEYRFGVKEGTDAVDYQFTKTHSYANHTWKHESTDDGTGLYTVHYYCSACGYEESYYQERYDDNGNTVYHKDLHLISSFRFVRI